MLLEIFTFNLLHIAHSVQGAEYSLLRDAAKYEVCDHSSIYITLHIISRSNIAIDYHGQGPQIGTHWPLCFYWDYGSQQTHECMVVSNNK